MAPLVALTFLSLLRRKWFSGTCTRSCYKPTAYWIFVYTCTRRENRLIPNVIEVCTPVLQYIEYHAKPASSHHVILQYTECSWPVWDEPDMLQVPERIGWPAYSTPMIEHFFYSSLLWVLQTLSFQPTPWYVKRREGTHATYVDGKILDVTKINFHGTCVDTLHTHYFWDPMKNKGFHGPPRRLLTSCHPSLVSLFIVAIMMGLK